MLISCNSPTTKPIPFFIPFAFDKQKWQEDSLACNGYRKSIISSIIRHEKFFSYQTHIDTFLHYFDGYHKVRDFNEVQYYYYWVEYGYHCKIDPNNYRQYQLAMESDVFFAVIVRQKDHKITNFVLGE
jgi:hypothetical protein